MTRTWRAGAVALCGLAVLGSPAAPRAQGEPSLDDVLARAGAYAVRYGEEMSSVIADEDYVQQLEAADRRVVARRHLESEIALVQLAGTAEWQSFRDVLRVDGEPVGDGPGRLERIFRDAPATVLGQARRLAADSARYNLGPLQRTFNTPTVMLQFLHPVHQDRFRIERRARESCDGEPCWQLELEERGRGTLIRTSGGRPVPISARLWISPADGHLIRGAFRLRDFLDRAPGLRPRADIDVAWRSDAHVGAWVPASMRERYDGLPPEGGIRTTGPVALAGTARYSNYRRFVVDYRIR